MLTDAALRQMFSEGTLSHFKARKVSRLRRTLRALWRFLRRRGA